MSAFREFLKRPDVAYPFLAMFTASVLVYADRLPVWALLAIVGVKDMVAFLMMKKGQSEDK